MFFFKLHYMNVKKLNKSTWIDYNGGFRKSRLLKKYYKYTKLCNLQYNLITTHLPPNVFMSPPSLPVDQPHQLEAFIVTSKSMFL